MSRKLPLRSAHRSTKQRLTSAVTRWWRCRCRPALEALESRLAPAAVSLVNPGWDALAEHPAVASRRELVVLDAGVPDREALLAGVRPGVATLVLSADRDGLTQIADALTGPAETTDLHILGHGAAGVLQLGDGLLNAAALPGHAAALARLVGELGPDSDILLYGCRTGAGASGAALVRALAEWTGAQVAASRGAVGSAALGGSWRLDVSTGPMDAAAAFQSTRLAAYPDRLPLGKPVAWGNNSCGQTTVPAGLTNVIAIAGGEYHTLALKSDGTVVAWGCNGYGQTTVPAGLSNVVAVAAGENHNLVVKSDGTVAAWGENTYHQTDVPPGLTVVPRPFAVAGSSDHSLAVKSDGTVAAWGSNTYGQTTVPAGLTNVVAVAAGEYHSLALKNDSTVAAWGSNNSGQTSVPAGLTNVIAIAAGELHSLALRSDGTVVAWGDNYYGQRTVPAGLTNVVAIAAGETHNLALKSDGTVVAWGDNSDGQRTVPAGLANVVAIAGGSYHSLALRAVGCTVTTLADSGSGSLRDCITVANSNPGSDTIRFAVSGTINLTSALPTITDPVVIDGTTAPGYTLGHPVVELNGSQARQGFVNGLTITAGSSTVKGLVIDGFTGHGIVLASNGGNVIAGNFIGTDVAGTARRSNGGSGVLIFDGSGNNTVGGPGAGAGNLLAGNGSAGIALGGNGGTRGTTANVVQGNFIGTDATGMAALGNGNHGVYVGPGASNNTIGGMASGAGNLIAGNVGNGLYLTGSGVTGNVVQGNRIGTNAAGTVALSNGSDGVFIEDAPNNLIGGTTAAARDVISGNNGHGILIRGTNAHDNQVEGNYLGTDVNGTRALGNGSQGVGVDGNAHHNTIGGSVSGARNLISGNVLNGISFSNTSANTVQGNYIGTDTSGTAVLGNRFNGVEVHNSSFESTIGPGNVISGNGLPPGTVSWFRAEGNARDAVSGNRGSLQGGATFAPGISGQAFRFDGVNSYVRIPDAPNLNPTTAITVEAWINPNSHVACCDPIIKKAGEGTAQEDGYALEFSGDQVVFYVFVSGGLGWRSSAQSFVPLGQWSHVVGVYDGSAISLYVNGVLIGSPTPAPGGIVASGNELDLGHDPSNSDRWYDGLIDEPALYSRALSTGEIQTLYNARGVSKTETLGDGVRLSGNAGGNVVQGNQIGTNAAGTGALGNSGSGVAVIGGSHDNTVGGPDPATRNLISANGGAGVWIEGSDATGNVIQGNSIGTDKNDRDGLLGNGLSGVHINGASYNLIQGNHIADNIHNGVTVVDGIGNTISMDSIHDNADLGIDLGDDGVTDCDLPVIDSTWSAPNVGTYAQGYLLGAPLATYILEFFANSDSDPSGYGEGEIYLGTDTVATNLDGVGYFQSLVAPVVPPGYCLSMTATDPDGTTWEFSACVVVQDGSAAVKGGRGDRSLAWPGLETRAGTGNLGTAHPTVPLAGWGGVPAAALVEMGQIRETETASRAGGRELLASRNQDLSHAAALDWLDPGVLNALVRDQLERA